MLDKLAIAWAIYRAATPENLHELTVQGNAGPIADAVIASIGEGLHQTGVSNRPLNAAALATTEPVDLGAEERARAVLHGEIGINELTPTQTRVVVRAMLAFAASERAAGVREERKRCLGLVLTAAPKNDEAYSRQAAWGYIQAVEHIEAAIREPRA